MPVLQRRDREAVKRRFDTEIKQVVDITLYTQASIGLYIPGRECRTCGPTQELIEEVSALSSRINLEVVDIYKSPDSATVQGVDRIPALVIGGRGDGAVKFFGMPSGFEFAILLDSIVASSSRRSKLHIETRRQLKRLKEDVHIRVFVTPNCQYSPPVARVAHWMALESPRVTADVIQIQDFPDMAGVYRVMGVPKTVINDKVQFTGAVPEDVFVQRVLNAAGVEEADAEEVEDVYDKVTPIA